MISHSAAFSKFAHDRFINFTFANNWDVIEMFSDIKQNKNYRGNIFTCVTCK